MFETIYAELQSNQFVYGAVVAWALATGTFLMRNIPLKIYQFIKRNVITTLTLNNGGFSQERIMNKFLVWASENTTNNLSRTLTFLNNDSIGLGYGFHIVFYKRRLFGFIKVN